MADAANETVFAHWTRLVHAKPDALALVEAACGRTWTRAALDAEAHAWHAALGEDISGNRVTFSLPNGAAWFAVFIGLLRVGAVPVPIDPADAGTWGKVSRNELCPCGSGKKYKHCHGIYEA